MALNSELPYVIDRLLCDVDEWEHPGLAVVQVEALKFMMGVLEGDKGERAVQLLHTIDVSALVRRVCA